MDNIDDLKEFIKVSYNNKSNIGWDNLVYCDCRDEKRQGLFKIVSMKNGIVVIELKCKKCKRFATVRIPYKCPNCSKIIKIKEADKNA